MNKDQVEGRLEVAKGKVKEAAGKLVGNERAQLQGRVDQAAGKLQAKAGDIRQAAHDEAQKLVDKI